MKFEFIGNACGIFHGSDGTQVLCDPWIVDGVFEGSWYHYPPLKTTLADLQRVDGIYLSHIHPDHYDERHFAFPKDIPIFILDEPLHLLEKKLRATGYQNLAVIPSGHTHSFREFNITLFAPFTKHPFHDAEVGNVIDSAMVIECEGVTALNANDNTPSVDSCGLLEARFGEIDLAMLNYNAAGPYPACFNNLSLADECREHARILRRNIEHMAEIVKALQPRFVLPFAGAYVLGGKLAEKNAHLGTCTWDECAEILQPMIDSPVVTLRERDVFDLAGAECFRSAPLDLVEMRSYIKKIGRRPYDYENDPEPDGVQLITDVFTARMRMGARMGKLGINIRSAVTLCWGDDEAKLTQGEGELRCTLDSRLLRRILDRKAHWNNAEIGCHIEFDRRPNVYEPDVHTALQFLHL